MNARCGDPFTGRVASYVELAYRWKRASVAARRNGMTTVLQARWHELSDDERADLSRRWACNEACLTRSRVCRGRKNEDS